jgi:hypothetical protein
VNIVFNLTGEESTGTAVDPTAVGHSYFHNGAEADTQLLVKAVCVHLVVEEDALRLVFDHEEYFSLEVRTVKQRGYQLVPVFKRRGATVIRHIVFSKM